MKAIFLGTGTSVGVPMIGCGCPVCRSADPRNRRRRSSLYLESGGSHLVVDTPPDFREQALEHRLPRVDAVFFTHSHADHIFGFDDIRRFNTIQASAIPAYGSEGTLADLRRIFDYAVEGPERPGVYRPRIEFRLLAGPVDVGPVRVAPMPVEHGAGGALGYRFDSQGRSLGYVPDCHGMADEVAERFRGVDVMILDALRHRPHPAHLTVADSVALLLRIGAPQSFLVHLCHDLDHEATERKLPRGIRVSFDGMALEW